MNQRVLKRKHIHISIGGYFCSQCPSTDTLRILSQTINPYITFKGQNFQWNHEISMIHKIHISELKRKHIHISIGGYFCSQCPSTDTLRILSQTINPYITFKGQNFQWNHEISMIHKIHISELKLQRWSLEFVISFSKVNIWD